MVKSGTSARTGQPVQRQLDERSLFINLEQRQRAAGSGSVNVLSSYRHSQQCSNRPMNAIDEFLLAAPNDDSTKQLTQITSSILLTVSNKRQRPLIFDDDRNAKRLLGVGLSVMIAFACSEITRRGVALRYRLS
jgi:hypothetical protein